MRIKLPFSKCLSLVRRALCVKNRWPSWVENELGIRCVYFLWGNWGGVKRKIWQNFIYSHGLRKEINLIRTNYKLNSTPGNIPHVLRYAESLGWYCRYSVDCTYEKAFCYTITNKLHNSPPLGKLTNSELPNWSAWVLVLDTKITGPFAFCNSSLQHLF